MKNLLRRLLFLSLGGGFFVFLIVIIQIVQSYIPTKTIVSTEAFNQASCPTTTIKQEVIKYSNLFYGISCINKEKKNTLSIWKAINGQLEPTFTIEASFKGTDLLIQSEQRVKIKVLHPVGKENITLEPNVKKEVRNVRGWLLTEIY